MADNEGLVRSTTGLAHTVQLSLETASQEGEPQPTALVADSKVRVNWTSILTVLLFKLLSFTCILLSPYLPPPSFLSHLHAGAPPLPVPSILPQHCRLLIILHIMIFNLIFLL